MMDDSHAPHPASPLDALALPLRGSHLIEASAGTGKTYTIAMLYVRLVLGHGGDAAGHGRPLTPPQILVVTFTEAATKELRDRIRARLAQAAAYFRRSPDDDPAPPAENLLHALRDQYPPSEWATCARKLDVAAQWMDEAAVSTIHGWCNRMLHEHAFDSLSLFTQTLETDLSELRADVVRDYWRQFYYPLQPQAAAQVAGEWAHPTQLKDALESLRGHEDKLPATAPPAELIAQYDRDREAILVPLKQTWSTWVEELQQHFDEAHEHGRLLGNKLRPGYYNPWLDMIRQWANSDQAPLPLPDAAWNRLKPEGMAAAWRNGQSPDHPALTHPALRHLPQVRETLQQLPDPVPGLLSHAARWVAAELQATQRRRSQLGFDDLLRNLDTALQGENGARLADTIRDQFPVALIDEFQDTDPTQYRIFERIYPFTEQRQDSAFIMIGDPKQAIYAFRGADIYTYLKARAAVGDRLQSLGTNYRSSKAMVRATNHCFDHAEQQTTSAGAFLFRRPEDNPVPFTPVEAEGLTATFQVEGRTPAALTLTVLPTQVKLSKQTYIDEMSEICATQLVDWLNAGQAERTGFLERDGTMAPLKPGDIAILVNNQQEANSIRRALARRDIRSVYLSDKDTVYDTPQATEVYRWLVACAEPDNDWLLRAALTTPSLGLDFPALEALRSDEMAWERRLLQFKGYQEMWRRQGVLPMIRHLLVDFDCAARLLNQPPDALGQSGERILTDLLHLAELLQQASFSLEGEHALIRFLAEHMQSDEDRSDERKLRLESDAHLVQVITIHKSKGLEYPLVMLPFICTSRPVRPDATSVTWHDETGEVQVSLTASAAERELADQERLAEDVRKLYVALTRARHLTWLGLAPLDNSKAVSAIDHLMGLRQIPPERFAQAVSDFAQGQPDIEVVHNPHKHDTRFQDASTSLVRRDACRPSRAAREHWWISSYSSLPMGGQRNPTHFELDDTAQTENWLEGRQELNPAEPVNVPIQMGTAVHPMHRFPKGAQPGTFLHDLLEWCANAGLDTVLASPDALREHIAQRCAAHRWDTWVDPLCDWVRQLLSTPLPAGATSIRLDTVTSARAEMEFWIETHRLDLQALDHAVTQHTLEARPRPALAPDSLTGMLKGFMDVVLEHEGRYYVADYKSNWLGSDEAAYTPTSMDEAIRANRYDLQYVLYLFALHRLLQSRLRDYDYDRHVGGALYLFLRGIAAPSRGVHFERPPKALMLELDRLFAGSARGTP